MFGIGLPELVVIMVVALLVFGPKKLPEIGKSIGKGLAELKRATEDFKESIEKDTQISSDSQEKKEQEVDDKQQDLFSADKKENGHKTDSNKTAADDGKQARSG